MTIDSTAPSSPPASLLTTIIGWFRGFFGPAAAAAQEASIPTQSENGKGSGGYVIAPGGYQIRVLSESDVPDSVGELLPEVREGLNLIPPLPHVVAELLREIQDPRASAASVAQVVSSDPALAASLLRMVNGAACGLSRKLASVPDAVSYLGFGVVKSMVLRLRLDSVLPAGGKTAQEARELWTHALAVSYIADALAESAGGVDRGFASTLALLHDIGKLALLTRFPERARQLRASGPAAEGESWLEREARLLGADHAAMGAMLALRWKLPADLVRAIRWHHVPSRAFDPTDPPALSRAVVVVHVANQLAKFCYAYSDEMEIDAVPPATLAALGLADSMEQLLSPQVRAAAARAIFMAEESTDQSPTFRRRLIVLHDGVHAEQLLKRLGGEAATGAVRLADDLKKRFEADFESAPNGFKRHLARASTVEIRELMDSLRSYLAGLDLPADRRQSAILVAQSLLANLASDSGEPATVLQWIEGGRLRLGLRSPWLNFARRFGAGADASSACRALEAELANVLNLGWLQSAETTPEGEFLVLDMPLAMH